MIALSLARRTAELVPMYAGHGATVLLNQVRGRVCCSMNMTIQHYMV